MPVLSCGGMRYQFKWGDVKPEDIPAENQRNLEDTIRRAVELGINHIETARGYGSSEQQLGHVLPKLPRDKIIVQTKIGPCDAASFLKTFETSMANLKLDYVDLLAIHGINTQELCDSSVKPGGCLEAARKLQKQGRCRWVGFSTHGPTDVIVNTIRAPGSDGRGFDYINLHWYYIFQRNWPAIEEATRRDMGVFIISPSDKGGKLYEPPQKLVDLCRPLHPIVFNDLFCLSHPQVHTLSIGAARPTDFDRHMEVLPLLDKAAEVLPPIQHRLETAMEQAVGSRDPESIMKHLPAPDNAPGGVNFPLILWLRNLALGWGMTEYGKMRYNMLGSGGHWFPGLNVEKLAGVSREDMKKAVAASPHAEKIEGWLHEAHAMLGGESVKRLSESK